MGEYGAYCTRCDPEVSPLGPLELPIKSVRQCLPAPPCCPPCHMLGHLLTAPCCRCIPPTHARLPQDPSFCLECRGDDEGNLDFGLYGNEEGKCTPCPLEGCQECAPLNGTCQYCRVKQGLIDGKCQVHGTAGASWSHHRSQTADAASVLACLPSRAPLPLCVPARPPARLLYLPALPAAPLPQPSLPALPATPHLQACEDDSALFCNGGVSTECYSGSFPDTSTGTCQACPANCDRCAGAGVCDVCDIGFGPDAATGACVPCESEGCQSCSSPGVCDMCEYFVGYWLDGGACQKCAVKHCAQCDGDVDFCNVRPGMGAGGAAAVGPADGRGGGLPTHSDSCAETRRLLTLPALPAALPQICNHPKGEYGANPTTGACDK